MVEKKADLSAQVGVLGSLLIQPELLGQAVTLLRPEDFTNPTYRAVFTAMCELFQEGHNADTLLVRDKLGAAYDGLLMQLIELTPTAAGLKEYARLTRAQGQVARIHQACAQIMASEDLAEIQGLMDKANQHMVARPGVQVVTMQEALSHFFDRLHQQPQYLSWGLPGLDDKVYAEAGDFIILGGQPSTGKTALAVQMALHMARDKRVGFFSLETGEAKYTDRLMAYAAQVHLGHIKHRTLSQEEYKDLAQGAAGISKRRLCFIPAGDMTVTDIRATALAQRLEVVFIDYVQLIATTGREGRTEEVSRISRALHTFAQTTGITVVGLSQLARPDKSEGRSKAPRMSSLRESGQLEADADAVLLLYLENEDDPAGPRLLKVAKNKEGERGVLRLHFDGAFQSFRRHMGQPLPQTQKKREREAQVSVYELPLDTQTPFDTDTSDANRKENQL